VQLSRFVPIGGLISLWLNWMGGAYCGSIPPERTEVIKMNYPVEIKGIIRYGDFMLGSLIRDDVSGVIFLVYKMWEGTTYCNSELIPLNNHKFASLSFSLDKDRERHYSNYTVLQY